MNARMAPSTARDALCFAVDVPHAREAMRWVELLHHDVGVFKIGLELFIAEGPALVREVRAVGGRVFLDLKLHDIPHTVAQAARQAAALDIDLLTVHASGGAAMMRAAVDGVAGSRTRVLAVTALTALDDADLAAVGYAHGSLALVPRLAALASSVGVHGCVCSPHEIEAVRAAGGPDFLVVTPGIRGVDDAVGDQKRTCTALEAARRGASHLVVGRPIRGARDPVAAARGIVDDIARGRTELT